MSKAPWPGRPVIIIRVLAFVSVALSIMCATLAWAWQSEREKAACWRVAAEFQTQREQGCRD